MLLAAQHRHGPARRSTSPLGVGSFARGPLVGVVTLATLALAGGPATARAHPQSSPDRNNRYLKLTPMADRVRLAYTVYLGDQPAAVVRRRLDRDRDGTIDEREAAVVGAEIAGMIRPAVQLTVDDRAVAIDWPTIDVGLGTPTTAAGALSVDLIGWACTGDGAHHRLVVRDRVRLELPGEIEVKLDEGPGVVFGPRRLGGEPMRDLIATWRGDETRLATGLEVSYDLDPALAVRPDDRRCAPPGPATDGAGRVGALVRVGLAALILFGGAVLLRWQRQRARPGQDGRVRRD